TGLGLVSPLGNSPESLWNALVSGTSGVGPLVSLPSAVLPTKIAAEAKEFTGQIGNFGPLDKDQQRAIKKALKLMCREIQMGVAAAQLAINHAGLKLDTVDRERAGVVYGSDFIVTMPEEFADGVSRCLDASGKFEFDRWASDGLKAVDPLWLLKYLPNMPNSHIAIFNDLRGPNNALTVREASANLALAEGFTTIARGSADLIVAGATGTRVHPLRTIHAVMQEQVTVGEGDPTKASRPFEAGRSGMVLGEGAGAVILESLEHAQARGATILGEIVGYGSSTVMDASGVGRIREAIANVLRQALKTSGLQASEVGHIHAHGLSTVASDAAEAAAIKQVFGDRQVPVTAAKSYFGNLGAAGGVVETIASVLALLNGKLFPILNYEEPAADCPIFAASNESSPGDSFINVNVTPQGQASAIAVRRWSAA
ncbi:MAG TPA: beta-ketoacyl-[acyl-carrier-protein] synthase family protein, partial [Pirellulaceae bacterium]|nr:beta-ketoacyl-[acyl-carrier-protein] synthase family protein [Pirellulaceae bacterium]